MKKWFIIPIGIILFVQTMVIANQINNGVITMSSIEKIKSPSVAGTFYSADKSVLEKQIAEFKKNSRNTYATPTRAVIVPHAGLV